MKWHRNHLPGVGVLVSSTMFLFVASHLSSLHADTPGTLQVHSRYASNALVPPVASSMVSPTGLILYFIANILFFFRRVSTFTPYHTRSFAPSLLVFLVYSTGCTQIEVTAVSVVRRVWKLLRGRVATIDTQLGAGHVAGGIGEEEGDGTHEVLRLAHLALRDERDPLLGELGVLVEDFLGAFQRDIGQRFVVDSAFG
jgi:hypothetical protein